ncbi:MAG: dhmA2 [Subtercola sp.]|nr:dhmA2 [Subtercola sp.]
MTHVSYHTVSVDGHQVFYREAGDPASPTVLLLHGAPASSFMFRELIPLLADRYHVVAPDYLGFGHSDSPSVDEFAYSFDALAGVVDQLTELLGLDRYAVYAQDYGAPVAWRLALAHPERITALISQNGNAYTEGFGEIFWPDVAKYTANPTAENATPLRAALTPESLREQYLAGAADPTTISPDTWQSDYANLQRPGNTEVALMLFADYHTNVELYPRVQQYFRDSQVAALIVWGKNDKVFVPAGAEAFRRDLPNAEIHLLDGGHFLLESQLETESALILDFLDRSLVSNLDRPLG